MQQLVRRVICSFMFVFLVTALVTLVGVLALWFKWTDRADLPYLGWLIGITIAEVAIVVTALAKRGFRYLPETITNRDESATLRFMEGFIASGTSATIVSNRASWLARSPALLKVLKEKASKDHRIEIYTPNAVGADLRQQLEEAGVRFYETGEVEPPEARFTLINADRAGAERLAIARGVHPDHEITIFDTNSGPQIIAMAKDIVRKLRSLADATSMAPSSRAPQASD